MCLKLLFDLVWSSNGVGLDECTESSNSGGSTVGAIISKRGE